MLGESVPVPMVEIEIPEFDDTSPQEQIIWERDLLGVELTQSPFTAEMRRMQDQFVVYAEEITEEIAGQKRAALGQIEDVRELTTRRGDKFLSLKLALLSGSVELVVWPNVLETTEELWQAGHYVTVTGTVRERMGRVSLSVETAKEYQHG
ncbi:MAG: OB-fold nucleic acid binding domain-containing protein, partial [Chloroflexota bacterium]